MDTKDEFLWWEKYRPHKVSEVILPKSLLALFESFVVKGEIQNMILHGTAGVGKTTVARALCEDLKCDYIIINGSEETGIDMLRTKLRNFATTVSFNGKPKVAIIDEAENMNPMSTQPAFRGFIEEFSGNCRFIFTTNYKERIIPAIHSRCAVIDFTISDDDKSKIASRFMTRVLEILKEENITYDKAAVASLIMKYFPDNRRILNELQRYSVTGAIDVGILATLADANLGPLMDALKEKDFTKMRTWVVNNSGSASNERFYWSIFKEFEGKTNELPQLAVLLNDYQDKYPRAGSKELNLVACFTEIMAVCSFK